MLTRDLTLSDVHPHDCDCPEHDDVPATGLTSLDVTCLQIAAGFLLGFLACEIYALLTGAPHVIVIFGGNG